MPKQKGPEVGFGLVPTGRYMGDVTGSVPNGVGPVIPGDFFLDKSTTQAVWIVNVGAALSSAATILGVFTGAGSTSAVANSSGNSSLYTGQGVILAGTTTPSTPTAVAAGANGLAPIYRTSVANGVNPEHVELFGLSSLFTASGVLIAGSTVASTPVAVSTAGTSGFGLIARSSIVGPNLQFEHVELFGLSSLYVTQGQILGATTVASTPAATVAPTVAGTAPVFRSSVASGLQFEVPNSTFYSGQGILISGSTTASSPVATPTPAAGNTIIFRTSVTGGWNPEAPASAGALITATTALLGGVAITVSCSWQDILALSLTTGTWLVTMDSVFAASTLETEWGMRMVDASTTTYGSGGSWADGVVGSSRNASLSRTAIITTTVAQNVRMQGLSTTTSGAFQSAMNTFGQGSTTCTRITAVRVIA